MPAANGSPPASSLTESSQSGTHQRHAESPLGESSPPASSDPYQIDEHAPQIYHKSGDKAAGHRRASPVQCSNRTTLRELERRDERVESHRHHLAGGPAEKMTQQDQIFVNPLCNHHQVQLTVHLSHLRPEQATHYAREGGRVFLGQDRDDKWRSLSLGPSLLPAAFFR